MHTRRDFLKHAAFLSGAAGALGAIPESIRRAMAIDPEQGSTFLDAEHVVILMQENRSFDHCFGSLQGVRGFNDPRAITLPDGNPVWVQADGAGKRFAPFRLDITGTKSTWMGSLPHSWTDQVDARNEGRYDRWLPHKASGEDAYAGMPLTMGFYTREDIPFYYALADAFTVCDQHFCASLTGTTPNRLYLWTGTVREKPTQDSPALVLNSDVDYGRWANWTTFPERLEDLGVPWKIYQNELSLASGFEGEEDAWLANFTDNPIEWFSQFNVRFARTHREFIGKRLAALPGEIAAIKAQLAGETPDRRKLEKQLRELEATLTRYSEEREAFTPEAFEKLSSREKSLHRRAFSTNEGDPHYRGLADHTYADGDTQRRVKVPKGDVLHQFREDVAKGNLPAVSWIVAPERFSDHPGSAWYGAWYLSEVLDILTKNPGVWKKTIFILTYDENDGYFDHVPPFVAPNPDQPRTGRVSEGIDARVEFVRREDELKRKKPEDARESAIGLGYRVPMVIASPWSRGGNVCSQVFDHTSVLQLLEKLLSHKLGKKVEEPNISAWRRAVCGDLSAAFRPEADRVPGLTGFLQRDAFIEQIHKAQFKGLPSGFRELSAEDLAAVRTNPAASCLPRQEPGVRPACPLPYELYASGGLSPDRARVSVRFEARNDAFGAHAAGAPFTTYAFFPSGELSVRNYAVAPGASVKDSWDMSEFGGGVYHLRVHGPNGFFRELRGSAADPGVEVTVEYSREAMGITGDVEIRVKNRADAPRTIMIRSNGYRSPDQQLSVPPGGAASHRVAASASFGWYDLSVSVADSPVFERRFAGHVETGRWSRTDPVMGAEA